MYFKIFLFAIYMAASVNGMAQKVEANRYYVSISFHSYGIGTPDAKPLNRYIAQFKKANKIKSISADHIGPLGREGEYKLAFSLKELNPKQRKSFIKNLNTVVESMKDRGSAKLIINETILPTSIPERATIEKQKF